MLMATTFKTSPVFWLAFLLIGVVGLWRGLGLDEEALSRGRSWERWPGLRQLHRTRVRFAQRTLGLPGARAFPVIIALAVIGGSLVGFVKSV